MQSLSGIEVSLDVLHFLWRLQREKVVLRSWGKWLMAAGEAQVATQKRSLDFGSLELVVSSVSGVR